MITMKTVLLLILILAILAIAATTYLAYTDHTAICITRCQQLDCANIPPVQCDDLCYRSCQAPAPALEVSSEVSLEVCGEEQQR